jgi:TonB family protein
MSNNPQRIDPLPVIPERRLSARLRIPSLGYVELGKNNGGILLNLGEGGLAVASATPLSTDSVGQMRFQIPGSRDWLEIKGEIVWLSESKREAGIRFVDLPEEARDRIKTWISSGAAGPVAAETLASREKAWRRLDTSTLTMPAPSAMGAGRPLEPSARKPFVQGETATRVPIYGLPTHRIFLKLLASDLKVIFRAISRGWGAVSTLAVLGTLALLWFMVGPGRKRPIPVALEDEASRTAFPAPAVDNSSRQPQQDSSAARLDQSSNPLSSAATSDAQALPQDASSPDAAAGERSRLSQPPDRYDPSARIARAHADFAEPSSTASSMPSYQQSSLGSGASASSASFGAQPEATSAAPAATASVNQPGTAKPPVAAEAPKPPKPVPPMNSILVSINGLPSIQVPAELKSQSSQGAAPLQVGQLLSRVDPVYPRDAEAQRIEGTVQLHVVIGLDGMVKSVQPRGGPAQLIPAAVNAVKQWSYTPSSVAGQPAEAEEDISVTFRLAK